MSSDIGIFGLSGRANNLAVNLASKGVSVSVGHRSSDMIKECTKLAEKRGVEDKLTGMKDANEFCESLSSPKKVILMAKAGTSIEKNLSKILSCLSEGDILVDASSEGFDVCVRRSKEVEEKGVKYMSMAILGTDREVSKGCGFLVSGERAVYDELEVILKKGAKEVEYEAALTYVGGSVSASYVELALKGLLTAEEEALSEAYAMLVGAGFTNEEVSKSIIGWNKEELEGPVVENMALVLRKKDDEGEGYVVDKVVDGARAMIGGDMLLREANDRRMCMSSVSAALSKSFAGAKVDERLKMSERVNDNALDWQKLDHVQLVEDLRNAVVCSVIMAYVQTLNMLRSASDDYEWSVKCSEVARVVGVSSMARCTVMDLVKDAMEKDSENVFADESVCEILQKKQMSWRRVAALAVVSGVSAGVITSSLSSFDCIRREKLPQNLVVAQRDYYSSSTFERTDMPRGMSYHCRWTKDHN